MKLSKDEDNKTVVVFDFDEADNASFDDLKCPVCGKSIVETATGFACSAHEEDGCAFSIGEVMGVKLNKSQVVSLIRYGKTGVIKGLKSPKNGETFSAKIGLNKDEEGKVKGFKLLV